MTAPQDPSLDAWGLPIIPPTPLPLDVEIGLTADEDGWGDNPPKPGPSINEFLRVLAAAVLHEARYLLIRSNVFRTRRVL